MVTVCGKRLPRATSRVTKKRSIITISSGHPQRHEPIRASSLSTATPSSSTVGDLWIIHGVDHFGVWVFFCLSRFFKLDYDGDGHGHYLTTTSRLVTASL